MNLNMDTIKKQLYRNLDLAAKGSSPPCSPGAPFPNVVYISVSPGPEVDCTMFFEGN